VFSNFDATGRNHESNCSGNIKGVGAVSAGADHIEDGFAVNVDVVTIKIKHVSTDPDGCGTFTHDPGCSGDLLDGFALHAQGSNEGADLSRCGFTGHDLIHDLDHFPFRNILSFNNLGNGFSDHWRALLNPINGTVRS